MRFRFVFVLLVAGLAGCEKRRAAPPAAVAVREDGAMVLAVMTSNVRYENPGDRGTHGWRQRVVGIVRAIRREAPDVIGVQEALHGQAADLWASLPDYEFYGVGRDDGLRAGEYSGIFYHRGRFEADAADCGTFWLSATPEKPGSRTWGNEIPRVATWVRLIDRASGRGFYVFNTHWDHKNQASREQAAVLTAARIDARKHPTEPVVLTGDFNSTEANPGLVYLRGEQGTVSPGGKSWSHGLVDTYQTLHPMEKNRRTLHFWNAGRSGSLKVDHILVSRGAEIQAAEILSHDKPDVSDHYPVTARVIFPLPR